MGEAATLLPGVRPVEGQVGVLALGDGLLVAIDLVGSSATWGHLAARAVRSCPPPPIPRSRRPGRARTGAHPRSGSGCSAKRGSRAVPPSALGDDFALAADGLIGSGVWLDGHPAHLSAFAPA